MLNRRNLIQAFGGGVALTAMGALKVSYAATPNDARLVVVILRGAMDGLHALVPYGDPHYAGLRRSLEQAGPGGPNGVLDLDGYFGLHPALGPLRDLYLQGDLLPIPAVATRYRERSHFDAQNVLENGTAEPFGRKDGWLNRALFALDRHQRLGLSIGPTTPLILQGRAGATSWSESTLPEITDAFLGDVTDMYAKDKLFADALNEARLAGDVTADTSGIIAKSKEAASTIEAATAAGDLLSQAGGPRVAVIESHGWDTHYSQAHRMDALLDGLAQSVMAIKTQLQGDWSKTAILVVSEFGRTARENGSNGTDHGTGGLALLAGGAVNGGMVGGDWPGLAPQALYQGRDVYPTTDYESIFKGVLIDHLGLAPGDVEQSVFPDAASSTPLGGLIA